MGGYQGVVSVKRLSGSDIASSLIEEAVMRNANELDLSGCGLVEIPESIVQLSKLRKLDLSKNLLTEVPEYLSKLSQLEHLNLSSNLLLSLPESICKLTKLLFLDCLRNNLQELPEFLGLLTRLQSLNISDNYLIRLPESICELMQLKSLNASNNYLRDLPQAFGRLSQLQHLDLSINKLSELPETVLELMSLNQLYLHDNPDLNIPVELLGPTHDEVRNENGNPTNPFGIFSYYFRVLAGQRPLKEAKLILIGRGGVGKTSIVNRLLWNIFRYQTETQGINIVGWTLQLTTTDNVQLNVWDFGGQEIMHTTHMFFLTRRSLYLLVLSGREGKEEADADYWLRMIESFGGDSPVIVVLNKSNTQPFDVNRRGLQQKFPFIRGFVSTDCEDGAGIERLRQVIRDETEHLEHVRDAIPTNWFTIKKHLVEMGVNYLSFEEYRRLCERYGETNSIAQEALADYLHNLGVILNYRDDPRLQDTHVLNPHWVTNGIYKILNSKKLRDEKGEIHLNDLSTILDGQEYPATMRRFIMDLMKKFELCFNFPDDDCHYLIPELLDKEESHQATQFQQLDSLQFQYHYSVLPEGLLPRFIVRTHTLSNGLPKWRTGVILKFEDCHALVKADVQDKKVLISVAGLKLSRRRLLAVIRSDFERIHNDLRSLKPVEMVPVPGYPNLIVEYKKLQVLEKRGEKRLVEVVGETIVEIDIHNLLNGIDLEDVRESELSSIEPLRPLRLFYSYSHRDEGLRNELETHLKLLQRRGLIEPWHDRMIEAGDEWMQQIDENLERADIVLLLVSSDFIASTYCYEKELKWAMAQHESGMAVVIPIIARNVSLEGAPFAKLQYLPKDGKAVTLWEDRDSAWRNVAEGIERVIKECQRKLRL